MHDGGKVHAASGFVCPAMIGAFERDAVGEADPAKSTDFCAYSALDGVYGTIKLMPLKAAPMTRRASLAPDFAKTGRLGGKRVGGRYWSTLGASRDAACGLQPHL